MFQVTYKAGWSQEYVRLGVYATREQAVAAVRSNLKGRKPKVWDIKLEKVEPMLRNARGDENADDGLLRLDFHKVK